MSYRLAASLATLRSEVNAAYPGRPKGSDGWIGDAKHSSRVSDHNPNRAGVVCAFDFTEWVVGENVQMNVLLAEHLRALRDPRLKYVICKGRMFSSYNKVKDGKVVRKAWEWGPYSGPNGHFLHVHVSVHGLYDSALSWGVKAFTPEPEEDVMTPEQEKRIMDAINNTNRRVGVAIQNQRELAKRLVPDLILLNDDTDGKIS